jgi:glycosyltransferase involved in cell wall biosynthesis
MRRLRIALVHPFCWPEVRRGGERYLHDLAWYLAGAGHDVHIITGSDDATSVTVTDGVTIRRCRRRTRLPGLHRPFGVEDSFGLATLAALLRHRFDLAHALTPTAAVACRLTGHPVVYTVLGHPTEEWLRQRGERHLRAFVTAVRLASATTALSHSAAGPIERLTGRQVQVLPPGVRTDQFTPDLRPRTGPPRILFPADASQVQKGLDFALAAVARLLVRRPETRLLLAGPGDHSWAVADPGPHGLGAEACRGLAVTDVLGVGQLTDMPSRYRAATVTVLPSINEAFGLVLAESLACGTPAVGSAACGIPEVLGDPLIGRTAPYGDVGALCGAMDEAIDLAAGHHAPSRCAVHARRWGWQEAVGAAHEQLYHEVLHNSRQRAASGPRR